MVLIVLMVETGVTQSEATGAIVSSARWAEAQWQQKTKQSGFAVAIVLEHPEYGVSLAAGVVAKQPQ